MATGSGFSEPEMVTLNLQQTVVIGDQLCMQLALVIHGGVWCS